jgi:amino acid transporter
MEGRPAGSVVMFKATADLGPNDGGVYDWIGRADNNEFVGFFTSAAYTGVFSMTRVK